MAWIQPLTVSGLYAYDTTLKRNSFGQWCKILAPRTISKIAMNWTDASRLASSAKSLCSNRRTFDLGFSPFFITSNADCPQNLSLRMERVWKNPCGEQTKEMFGLAHPTTSHSTDGLGLSCSLPYFLSFQYPCTFSCLIKLRYFKNCSQGILLGDESNNSGNVFKLTPGVFIGSQPWPDDALDFWSVGRLVLDLLYFQE